MKKTGINKIIWGALLLLSSVSFAQPKDISQLKNDIVNAKSQENKIDAINKLGLHWFDHNFDSATYYFEKAHKISKEVNYNTGLFDYALYMGDIYLYQGKFEEDIKLMESALKLARVINDKHREALFVGNIGNGYMGKGEYEKAIEYTQESIKLFELNNEPDYVSKLNLLLSLCFFNSDNLDKSIEYAKLSFLQSEKAKDSVYACHSLSFIGKVYIEKEGFHKAKPYLEKAYNLALKNKDNIQIADIQVSKSRISLYEKKYREAINWCLKSLAFYEETGNIHDKVSCLTILSKCYLMNGDKAKALESVSKAEKLALKTQLLKVYEIYSEVSYELGNYKDAYLYYDKRNTIRDSINKTKLQFNIQNLDAKFQSAQKDKSILLLEKNQLKQRTFIYLLATITVGLLVFSFLLYKNYRARKKINEQQIIQLQQEKKIDATQNMIQGEEQERTRLARDLHDGLGGMLSGVKFQLNSMKGNVILSEENAGTFTKSISQIDNAIAEMRRVAHNMMPEALLKFGLDKTLKSYCDSVSQSSDLTVSYQSFGMKTRLEHTYEIVLYRIVQELLNNTIKHAQATKSTIQLSKNNNLISLTVEDNGNGYDVNTIKKRGIGISNINHRVEYLNGKIDMKSDNKGTSTHIEFEII